MVEAPGKLAGNHCTRWGEGREDCDDFQQRELYEFELRNEELCKLYALIFNHLASMEPSHLLQLSEEIMLNRSLAMFDLGGIPPPRKEIPKLLQHSAPPAR